MMCGGKLQSIVLLFIIIWRIRLLIKTEILIVIRLCTPVYSRLLSIHFCAHYATFNDTPYWPQHIKIFQHFNFCSLFCFLLFLTLVIDRYAVAMSSSRLSFQFKIRIPKTDRHRNSFLMYTNKQIHSQKSRKHIGLPQK